MKIEQEVKTVPFDNNFNNAMEQLQKEGWVVLPGGVATLPMARTMNDDGSIRMPSAAPMPDPNLLGSKASVELDDTLVFLLRDGKLYDADGKPVSDEERARREAVAERRRRDFSNRKMASAGGS